MALKSSNLKNIFIEKVALMKIPVRMISIISIIFWVFLIGFFVSAVYSIKDLQFDLGEPKMSTTPDNKIIFSLPVNIVNNGYYNIDLFNVSTGIADKEGTMIAQGSSIIPLIKRDENITINHNVTLDFYNLENYEEYLFQDIELKLFESVSMRIAEAIPVKASINHSMLWGAPLHNLSLGEAEYIVHNQTHLKVIIPMTFENHAFFDLSGSVQTDAYNNNDILCGEGQTILEAEQNTSYHGTLDLYILTTEITEDVYFEVYFQTSLFNYGPLVIFYE